MFKRSGARALRVGCLDSKPPALGSIPSTLYPGCSGSHLESKHPRGEDRRIKSSRPPSIVCRVQGQPRLETLPKKHTTWLLDKSVSSLTLQRFGAADLLTGSVRPWESGSPIFNFQCASPLVVQPLTPRLSFPPRLRKAMRPPLAGLVVS